MIVRTLTRQEKRGGGDDDNVLLGNRVQLFIVHVEMQLQLFRAYKPPITLITRPILLLLPQH